MNRYFLFGLALNTLLLLLTADLAAQDRSVKYCGTEMGRSAWLQNYQRNPGAVPRTEDTLFVPVYVHMVTETDGTGGANLSTVKDAFCTLNADFSPSKIQFYISGVSVLPNSSIYSHSSSIDGLFNNYKVSGSLNSFFVKKAISNENAGYWTPLADVVVIDIDALTPGDRAWSHEVGHFLSLPHTFFGWENVAAPDYSQPAPEYNFYFGRSIAVEKADGSNCSTAADGFCDTAADYLNIGWFCQSNNTSEQVQLDQDSVAFRSFGNIMSYGYVCTYSFSQEQEAAMRANLQGPRNNLVTYPSADILGEPDLSQLNLVEPATGTNVTYFDSVRLSWTPVESALGYVVQLNIINDFSQGASLELFSLDTTLLIQDGLAMNRRYFWRVSPVMPYRTCENDFSPVRNFRTGSTSPVSDPVLSGALKVYPNPVANGTLVLELNDGSLRGNLDYEFLDRLGRVVRRGTIGNFDTTRIDVSGLPQGIYFLRARADGRFTTKKIVVN